MARYVRTAPTQSAAKPKKPPSGAAACTELEDGQLQHNARHPGRIEGLEVLIPIEVNEPDRNRRVAANEVSVQGGEAEEQAARARRRAETTGQRQRRAGPVRRGRRRLCADARKTTAARSTPKPGSHPFQLTATVDFNQTLEVIPVAEGDPPVKGLEPAARR